MYILRIDDIRLPVHLGVTLEEQAQPQMVRVEIHLIFKEMPQGCVSDNINDTVCYAGLVDIIQSVVAQKPYHLIEHLNNAISEALVNNIDAYTLSVSVCKLSPPVPSIHGGVTFTSVKTTTSEV